MFRNLLGNDPELKTGDQVFWQAGFDPRRPNEYLLLEGEILHCLPESGKQFRARPRIKVTASLDEGADENWIKEKSAYILKVSRIICAYPPKRFKKIEGKIVRLGWLELLVYDGCPRPNNDRCGSKFKASPAGFKRLKNEEGVIAYNKSLVISGDHSYLNYQGDHFNFEVESANKNLDCACCRGLNKHRISYRVADSEIEIVLSASNDILWIDPIRFNFPGQAQAWPKPPQRGIKRVIFTKTFDQLIRSPFYQTVNL